MVISCFRCHGLLVQDWAEDLRWGEHHVVLRCVNCGNQFDELTLKNRANPPEVVEHSNGRNSPRHSFAFPKESRVHT